MNEEWDGVERRTGRERRSGQERRNGERRREGDEENRATTPDGQWDRRSGLDRRGHPIYQRSAAESVERAS